MIAPAVVASVVACVHLWGTPCMTIDQILDDLIRREGGYVHDPVDRGGPTKYGITQRTLRAWRGRAVTVDEVRRLTEEEARAIYHRRYVSEPGFTTLPDPLRAQVVDDGVMSGPRQAVRDLQRAIGRVRVDGVLGPNTRRALARQGHRVVHARLIQERTKRSFRIVKTRPDQGRFLQGWIVRITGFAQDLAEHPSG